jgi:hypothetical protein
MSESWVPFMKSKRKFQMNRIAVFALLAALSVSWSVPAKAQDTGVAEYARQSRKANKKAAKEQRKARKKYVKAQRKAQRKAVKKANHHPKYRTPSSARFLD